MLDWLTESKWPPRIALVCVIVFLTAVLIQEQSQRPPSVWQDYTQDYPR